MKLVAVGLVFAAVAGSALAQYQDHPQPSLLPDPSYSRAFHPSHDEDEIFQNVSHRVRSQCRQLTRLSRQVEHAANASWVNSQANGNLSQVADILAKAQAAHQRITTIQSDPALVATCNAIRATLAENKDCRTICKMESLNKLVANATLLNSVTGGNTTEANILIAKAAANQPTLSALQANASLTQFCSVRATEKQCRRLARLTHQTNLAANLTALNSTFQSDPAKIARFRNHVILHANDLANLMANSTLTSYCSAHAVALRLTQNAYGTWGSAGVKTLGAPLSLAGLLLLTLALL